VRILITGGNSSIAQALAIDRLVRGDEVILTASSDASRETLLDTCSHRSISASCAVFDLRHPETCSTGFGECLQTIDGLILNAATRVRVLDRFHELPGDEVDAAIDSDIKGNLFLLRRVLPGMAKRRFGRIVFVSSVSVVMGTARYGVYCLTKSALEGLMLNLAVDYGGCNVLSNVVRLGLFKTRRTERFWRREKYARAASLLVPQGTLGEVSALPEAIHPLLSATQYINGSVVTVSGGLPLLKTLPAASRTND
jgi:3-oxoacyl-[acyl-carrier protein] reductase